MSKYADAADMILEAKGNVVVLTGAGISTDSGIPDFRSEKTGLWNNIDPMECLSSDVLRENPTKFYKFFNEFKSLMLDKEPNEAHRIFADLETSGVIKWIITQNVDDLHQKAGSKNVLQVHGNLTKCYCPNCDERYDYDKVNTYCKECSPTRMQRIRPDIVLFGDSVDKFPRAEEIVMDNDLLICIGTSLSVYPVANLPCFAKKVIIINRDKTEQDSDADIVFNGEIIDTLKLICKEIK